MVTLALAHPGTELLPLQPLLLGWVGAGATMCSMGVGSSSIHSHLGFRQIQHHTQITTHTHKTVIVEYILVARVPYAGFFINLDADFSSTLEFSRMRAILRTMIKST